MMTFLENKANLSNRGVIPDFIENNPELMAKDDMLYMFEIYYSENSFDFISFLSRWSPALDTVFMKSEKKWD